MDVPDIVKEWSVRCSQCGECKAFERLFLPSCPPGHKFKFTGYFPTGRMMIGRGLQEGMLTIEDDDVLERLYTCTACKACDVNCGNLLGGHIVDVIEGMRQMAVSAGCTLPAHEIMIASLKKNDNVLDRPKEERGDWAVGLGLKDIAADEVDVAYRAGCLLSYDPELRGVALAALKLLRGAGVDVGIEGRDESCCGGRAYEIGQVGEFTKYAEHNIEAYNNAGVGTVVVSCADGLSHLKLLYPRLDIKMNFEVLHLVEYLDRLIQEGRIKFTRKVPMRVTYHDPCHLGRYAGIYDAPRDILRRIPGLELVEMERSREHSWCCGAGGGVKQAYPEFSLWAAEERIREAKGTGAAALVTSCPWCERNFKDAVKEYGEDIEVYDIAEIAAQAIEPEG
jgi:Fe-S oxidoreductase